MAQNTFLAPPHGSWTRTTVEVYPFFCANMCHWRASSTEELPRIFRLSFYFAIFSPLDSYPMEYCMVLSVRGSQRGLVDEVQSSSNDKPPNPNLGNIYPSDNTRL